VLPAIVLLWGAHGHRCIRERRLQPAHLARILTNAQREAERAEVPTARARALLTAYRRAAARQFRPPTPPPTPRELEAKIVAQQDADFAAALEADQAAELAAELAMAESSAEAARAAEEEAAARQWAEAQRTEAARAAEAAEARHAAMREARRIKLAERCTERLRRAEALAFEPPPTQASTITLAVRLRDGGRIQRRFEHSTRLVDVFAWVGAHVPAALARFTLVSRYPRVTLDVEEEGQGARTLEEVGLGAGAGAAATVFVEGEEEEEDIDER
jgi:hypothetical protein